MEYSNETQSNIIPQESFAELTQEVFDVIASNLSRSLGPMGSSAMILDGAQTEATKDGFAIFKSYRFHNRYKKMIYNLIMAPCTKMNNIVGDGTTTAVVLARNMFRRYRDAERFISSLYRMPRTLVKTWDSVVAEINEKVMQEAQQIDPSDYNTIYNLAYVTSNGNEEISDAIAKTYQESKSPSIKQKDSPTNKSYISKIDGFDFPANLINDIYVRNQDLTREEENIPVMIFDHKIDSETFEKLIRPVNDVMRAMGKKLLVIAPSYDMLMCETVLDQYIAYEMNVKGGINLIFAMYDSGKLEQNQLTDLAIILRAKIINQPIANEMIADINSGSGVDVMVEKNEDTEYKYKNFLGIAARALLSRNTGSLFHVNDIESDERYQHALERAQKDLDDISSMTDNERKAYSMKIYDANARLMQLKMNNYIYYIGADSMLQKKITWDSVDDVIKCLKSAIKYGVVPGCQITISKICKHMKDDITQNDKIDIKDLQKDLALKYSILEIIDCAVLDTYAQVLNGPDGNGMIKTIHGFENTKDEDLLKLHDEAVAKCIDIIHRSVRKGVTFDVESLTYSNNIITSAQTDTMVLTAASELIKILTSGNQCIFIDAEVNGSHQEEVQCYV